MKQASTPPPSAGGQPHHRRRPAKAGHVDAAQRLIKAALRTAHAAQLNRREAQNLIPQAKTIGQCAVDKGPFAMLAVKKWLVVPTFRYRYTGTRSLAWLANP